MDNCFGIINQRNIESNFGRLCKNRPVYMLPFASRYRIIDVAISNMVNNGIKTIAVYTGEKIRSTMDHLSDGKSWSLNSRFQGLFLYPPVKQDSSIEKLGDISDLYSTIGFIESLREENVFIMEPSSIYMVNLDEAYEEFVKTDSDITLMYIKVKDEDGDYINTDKLHLDEDKFVDNIGINLGTELEFNMFINSILIKKEVLLKLIRETVEKGNANSVKDAIIKNKNLLKINSYELDGLVQIVKDTSSYFKANLDLLEKDCYRELFYKNGKVMTKTKDEPPTLYMNKPRVENSLIANGCFVEGDVENSVIFRGVKIEKGAIVKNSIIMQKSEIKAGAVVINSIIDKYAVIEEEVSIVGSINQPFIVEKNGLVKKD